MRLIMLCLVVYAVMMALVVVALDMAVSDLGIGSAYEQLVEEWPDA